MSFTVHNGGRQDDGDGGKQTLDLQDVVRGMAELPPADYELRRADAANQFKIRVTKLDVLVDEERDRARAAAGVGVGTHIFNVENGNLYYREYKSDTPMWVCTEFEIKGAYRDSNGQRHGMLISWTAPNGKVRQLKIPAVLLAGDGTKLREVLLDAGLRVSTTKPGRDALLLYLSQYAQAPAYLFVDKPGWYGSQFALPNQSLGHGEEQLLFDTEDKNTEAFTASGTLDTYKANVLGLCAGNRYLVFGVCVGLAAPLLPVVGEDGGGFNLVGGSSIGKTTSLLAQVSVFEGPLGKKTWNSTKNNFENLASSHNHVALAIDEMAQANPSDIGEVAYALANGQGKQRASRNGSARPVKNWLLLFLSTGEVTLQSHMKTVGKTSYAGQEVRNVDLQCETFGETRMLEELHGRPTSKMLTDEIKDACKHHYGTLGPAFVDAIAKKDLDDLRTDLRKAMKDFETAHVPPKSDSQVHRVATRFALLAAAGELATKLGLTGWNEGEAEGAVAKIFARWIEDRGGVGALEDEKILAQVRGFIEAHGESRFTDMLADREHPRVVTNRVGFRQWHDFYVLPEAFKTEICGGFPRRRVVEVLTKKGWLISDANGSPSTVESLDFPPRATRVYHLRGVTGEPGMDPDDVAGFKPSPDPSEPFSDPCDGQREIRF